MSQSRNGGWQQPPFVVSKGGLPTATTYFKKHKISKGETVTQSLKERFDYGQNPDKTQGGELISSYECDYITADAEFLLSKAKYKAATGREQRRDADVLCYQIRQSFKPGEITPEEANRVGYETAMRWTKGKYAFFVATHTDRQHIHNHIYYNSTSLDCSHKFRDFIGSARAVRRLSDRVCLENDLSVITNPKLHRGRRHTALYCCWEYLSCFATNPGCVENPLIKRLSMAPDFGGYFGIVGAGRWHSSPMGSKPHSISTQRPPIGAIPAYGGGTGGVCAGPPA